MENETLVFIHTLKKIFHNLNLMNIISTKMSYTVGLVPKMFGTLIMYIIYILKRDGLSSEKGSFRDKKIVL